MLFHQLKFNHLHIMQNEVKQYLKYAELTAAFIKSQFLLGKTVLEIRLIISKV